MTTVTNLATGDLIDEPWVDSVYNAAWGKMGSVYVSVDQTGITALADLTSYSITFTAVANRIYVAHWTLAFSQLTTGGAAQTLQLNDGTTTYIVYSANGVGTAISTVSGFRELTGYTAGSKTFKLRASTSAGTLTIANASAMNGRFAIYDMGGV